MAKSDVLRTPENIDNYREKRKNVDASTFDMRKLPLRKKWEHWILVENEYPYDKISEDHCLLVPLRKFKEDRNMTEDERNELFGIKAYYTREKLFDAVFENLKHNRTVPNYYHLHFLKFKYRTPIEEL